VFRRGYADKGTLRPDDQKRYQELGELGEVQIDEVPFAHPLPFQWTGNENPREPSGERELFLRKVRKSKRKEETNMGMLKRIENLKLQNQRIEEKIQSYQELLRTNRQTIEDIENRFSIHQENEKVRTERAIEKTETLLISLEKKQEKSMYSNKFQ
jgi:hypothetical protein